MTPINHDAIDRATAAELRRWLRNLETALRAPRPADLSDFQYSETTRWIMELEAAIRSELDRRHESSDNHEHGAGRNRAAI